MRSIRPCLAGLFVGSLFLAGCVSVTSAPVYAPSRSALTAFAIQARFSLRQDDKNYSGRLSWRHEGPNNDLLLSSPFGQGIAQISTDEQGARLTTSDGKSYSAANTEELTRQVLGYPLPLERLVDWVRARSERGEVETRDALGRPLHLRHDDWRIDYGYDGDDPDAPPTRIFAVRTDGLDLRLRIDEWNALPQAEAGP